MSRRKQRPSTILHDGAARRGSPAADAYEAERVEIGCTGRGSHKRIKLAGADVMGDAHLSELVPVKGNPETFSEDGHFVEMVFSPEQHLVLTVKETDYPHFTIPFECLFCDRNLPLRQDNLFRKLRVLKAAKINFLDLSSLDAIS